MFRSGRARRGPTLRECILVHAAARLTLGPAGLTNIQASWVKMGPEMAGRLLSAGCNDMGGTLMNESITRAAGQGLTLVHFSAQLELCLTQENTLNTP